MSYHPSLRLTEVFDHVFSLEVEQTTYRVCVNPGTWWYFRLTGETPTV